MMKMMNIAIFYNPLLKANLKEVKDVKKALESYENTVVLYKANKDIIKNIQKNNYDMIFNLTHDIDTNLNSAMTAICELSEIKVISPKIFTSLIVKDKDLLFDILKYDNISVIENIDSDLYRDMIEVFLLENKDPLIFINKRFNHYISDPYYDNIKRMCVKSFKSIHGSNYCKFQILIDALNNLFLTNINPFPYLGKNNIFPKLVKQNGIEYADFINYIIANAAYRYHISIPEIYEQLRQNFNLYHQTNKILLRGV
ncbi:MAG: hypothetical protein EU551_01220 [Promethearchaeota archaeon]|nr:MAG: hypothetical protein EU551_01220 [Candidatus Lokiarchaeota archaeon]